MRLLKFKRLKCKWGAIFKLQTKVGQARSRLFKTHGKSNQTKGSKLGKGFRLNWFLVNEAKPNGLILGGIPKSEYF